MAEDMTPAAIEAAVMIPAAIAAEGIMARAAAVDMAVIAMAAAAVTSAGDTEAAVNLLLLLLFPAHRLLPRWNEMVPGCPVTFQEHVCMHLIK